MDTIGEAVEKSVSSKGGNARMVWWYKIRWKGYGELYGIWENASFWQNMQEVVKAWHGSDLSSSDTVELSLALWRGMFACVVFVCVLGWPPSVLWCSSPSRWY